MLGCLNEASSEVQLFLELAEQPQAAGMQLISEFLRDPILRESNTSIKSFVAKGKYYVKAFASKQSVVCFEFCNDLEVLPS